MDRTTNLPKNLFSYQPKTKEKPKDRTNEKTSSFQRAIPKASDKPAPRRPKKLGERDPVIKELGILHNEVDDLNLLVKEFDQAITTSSSHSEDLDVESQAESDGKFEHSTASQNEISPPPDSSNAAIPRQSFFVRPSTAREGGVARVGSLRDPASVKQANAKQKRDVFKSTKSNAVVLKTNVPSILEKLPTGMILDIDGNISGKHQFTRHPVNQIKYSNAALEEVVREGQSKLLGDALSLGGVRVVDYAQRDFDRLTYEIPTKDGRFNPLPRPSDEQIAQCAAQDSGTNEPTAPQLTSARRALRQEQIARALRDFVQDDDQSKEANDNAAFVLSSTMTQHVGDLLRQVVYPDTPFVAVSLNSGRDNNGQDRPLTIRNSFNQEQPVVVKGLGGDATFALSRDGKNFKMTLDYPTYVEARHGREKEFPLHKDGVVRIHLRTEILVDGDQARSGVLAVTMPGGIQAEYSGRLKLS